MTRLDIFSDPVCPWCLIGKLELDAALAKRPDHPFSITWHPFRLNPQMPAKGMNRAEYLTAKFGENAASSQDAFLERAAQLGVTVVPPVWQPDTTNAHRLMHWAGLEGVQDAVMTGLLKAHWFEGEDIADPETLTRIAAAAGMNIEATARLLASDADRDEVTSRDSHARQRGINSIPTFIVADTHAVSGAQPAALWENVIDELTGAVTR